MIESKVDSVIAPHQTKKDFLNEDKKTNSSRVSIAEVFLC